MSGVYLSAPEAPPPPPEEAAFVSSQHEWLAWDGTVWDLSHGTSGLALQTGVRGMHMPPITRYSLAMPAVAGTMWRGSITDERTVFWPIRVFNNVSSDAWIAHNRKFWKTLLPEHTGLWRVVQPSGEFRQLRVRFTEETDDADDLAPELQGWALYGVNLVAEKPYWQGEPITRNFGARTSENFFGGPGGTGFGPPFYITSGTTIEGARITNPGEVAAWPTWRVKGPCTDVTVGLDGHLIKFPMDLTASQWVEINTEPTSQVAYDQAGVDRSLELTSCDFREVPPGDDVALDISIVGGGSVQVTITPQFYRAM